MQLSVILPAKGCVIPQCNFISGVLQILPAIDIVNVVSGKYTGRRTVKSNLMNSKDFLKFTLVMHKIAL